MQFPATSVGQPRTSDESIAMPATYNSPNRSDTSEGSTDLAEESLSVTDKRKTLGGFEALTWEDYRKDPSNFIPKCNYAKDLPHSLQDQINQMSSFTRMMPNMRVVFEGMIRENTLEDEPFAPPIILQNDVDDEPTPLWEFYYTNKMWYGEGVPEPDITNLVSCDCKGECQPKSETCACLKRQKEAVGDPSSSFAYDEAGKLRALQSPIYECNDLCGCGPECQNRVVQQGRKVQIVIKKTKYQRWSVFAGARKILSNTFIGIYAGELLSENEAGGRMISYKKAGRTYLVHLDFHYLRGRDNQEELYTVDAFHAGNFTRFLDYSSDPNVKIYPCFINEGNVRKPLLAVFSSRDIDAGEEICLNYFDKNEGEQEDEDGNNCKN